MADKYDPRAFTIDTFNLTAFQTDPAVFTQNAIHLAAQLAQNRRQESQEAAIKAGIGAFNDPELQKLIDPSGLTLPENDGYILPHQFTFSQVYNSYKKYYYYYFDEALRNSYANALAMRRDGLIQELLRHRQLPTASLDHDLKPDDPDDKEQVKVTRDILRTMERTRRFQSLKIWLLEWIFFGKSGVQLRFGQRPINGVIRNYVNGFMPIQGDKIAFKWDGTPGVMVYAGAPFTMRPEIQQYIDRSTIAPTFYLYNPAYKKKFIIGEFEPSDFDYLFEGEKAAAVHGIGLRDRFYWTWNMATEVLSWLLDALQRVGANGMLYAFYQSGNPQSLAETILALKRLVKENVSAFPRLPGDTSGANAVNNIEPAPVGYDVLFQMLEHLIGILRRGFLGQNLSSQSEATGLGSGQSEFHADMFQNIVLYDANCLAETLDEYLLPAVKDNNIWTYKDKKYRGDDLPFGMQYELSIDRENIQELIDAASKLHEMGVLLDADDLRDKAGLKAPKTTSTTIGPAQPTAPAGAPNGKPAPTNGQANGKPHVMPGRPPQPGQRPTQMAAAGGQARGLQPATGGNGKPERYSKSLGTTKIRLTFIPRVRTGVSLFASRREWSIGDDSKPSILLAMGTGEGGYVVYTYDNESDDYVPKNQYGLDEFEAALTDAESEAERLAKEGTYSETIELGDNEEFNHLQHHSLARDCWDVTARVIGSWTPAVDCWVEALTVSHPEDGNEFASSAGGLDKYERRDDDPGVMIALNVPATLATQLALPNGETPDELHVTLAYLGRLSKIGADRLPEIVEAVKAIAENYPSLTGLVGGLGRFSASDTSDGKDVLYASVDVPGLSEFRSDLVRMLDAAEIPYHTDHGFTPHITLLYLDPAEDAPVARIQPAPISFGALCLTVGGKTQEFPFEDRLGEDQYQRETEGAFA